MAFTTATMANYIKLCNAMPSGTLGHLHKKQQNHARKIALTSYVAGCGIGVASLNRKETESTQ